MLLLMLALFFAPAVAADDVDDTDTGMGESALAAEYKRLHEELDRLAQRNAWAGMERTYQAMVETGVPLRFADLRMAAAAAQAAGDVSAQRERLERAVKAIDQEQGVDERVRREVINALWALDDAYGLVYLAGDPGVVELKPAVMPFDPSQVLALQRAMAQITETGVFEGLLPKGSYAFGGATVEVRAHAGPVRYDLRSAGGVRKSKKAMKKADKDE